MLFACQWSGISGFEGLGFEFKPDPMRLGSDWLSSAEGVRKPLQDLPDAASRLKWDVIVTVRGMERSAGIESVIYKCDAVGIFVQGVICKLNLAFLAFLALVLIRVVPVAFAERDAVAVSACACRSLIATPIFALAERRQRRRRERRRGGHGRRRCLLLRQWRGRRWRGRMVRRRR